MSEHNIIARPYAKAAFEFAVANQQMSAWVEQLQIMAEIARDERVVTLVKAPQVSDASVAELIADICKRQAAESFNQGVENFIKLLAQNHRILVLPNIAQLFEIFRAKHEQFVDVHVSSCFPFGDEQKDRLQKVLETRFAKRVLLHFSEDKSLIGGARIRAGDTVIDGSVRGKLNRLANHLNMKETLWH